MSLSQVQYEQLDSGITDFSVTFEYISRDHVKVTVNGTPVGFTWLNNETVKLDTAPAIGDIIDIRRQTERENLLVQFQDASTITETQLDLSARQSFYLSQESIDRSEATLGVTEDGSYSANSRRITRMGDPEDDSDATTKGWVKNEYQSGVDAGVARDEAQAARDKAKKWAEETTDTLVETGKYSAKHHANKASGSAAAASTSETNAGNSEASAANSATEAGNSAFAAGTSEENAGNSESRAFSWAEEAEDVEVEPGQFSAKHHATKAEGYAAGLNVPSAAGNANKFLQQKADESGFQYVPLGTAKDADVQTSPTDTTPGRIPTVEDARIVAADKFLATQGRRNLIINGGFDVWQRGTSFDAGGTIYTADRWESNTQQSGVSIVRGNFSAGQTQVEGNPKHFIQCSKNGLSVIWQVRQKVEDVRLFSGQTVVLTFWMPTGATAPEVNVFQNFGDGGSSQVKVVSDLVPETVIENAIWTKYKAVMSLPSISGKTLGDNNYTLFQVIESEATEVDNKFAMAQLEAGDTATPFEQRSYGEELALCQRYYQTDARQLRQRVDTSGDYQVAISFCQSLRDIPAITITISSTNEGDSFATRVITISSFEYVHDCPNVGTAAVIFTYIADAEL